VLEEDTTRGRRELQHGRQVGKLRDFKEGKEGGRSRKTQKKEKMKEGRRRNNGTKEGR
jgi:hypothetical protein